MSFMNDSYSRCGRQWPHLRKRGRARGRGPYLHICRAGVGTWRTLATGSFANLDVCNGGFPSQTNKTKEHGLCTLWGIFRALCGPAWAARNLSIWLHDGDVGWNLATLTPSSPVSSALGVPEPVAGLVDVFVWEGRTGMRGGSLYLSFRAEGSLLCGKSQRLFQPSPRVPSVGLLARAGAGKATCAVLGGLLPHWVSPQGRQDDLPGAGRVGATAAVGSGRLDPIGDWCVPSVSDAGCPPPSSLGLGYRSRRHSWSQFWVNLGRR